MNRFANKVWRYWVRVAGNEAMSQITRPEMAGRRNPVKSEETGSCSATKYF